MVLEGLRRGLRETLDMGVQLILGVGLLFVIVGLPLGVMFGITHIINTYGYWYFLLYIPWFIGISWMVRERKE